MTTTCQQPSLFDSANIDAPAAGRPTAAEALVGRTVQYRKVGTFQVTGLVKAWASDLPAAVLDAQPGRARVGGWFTAVAVDAPKAYRDGGRLSPATPDRAFWLDDTDVID